MIERFIESPLTLKRWRLFKSRKLSWASLHIFLFFLFVSLTAEFWANSRPILLFYKGSLYAPAAKRYHPKEFGAENQIIMDYRQLRLGAGDWALWPPIPWDPLESNTKAEKFPGPPSRSNLLGTDDRGRDMLSRLIYGFRYSMIFAFSIWLLSYIIGSFLGALMGYFGGLADLAGQRAVEIVDALPSLVILITITAVLGRSLALMIVFFSLINWVPISLYMRGEFLRLRKRLFVEASRALGRGHMGIIFKHILPNSLTPIITFSPFALAMLIGYLSVLDYLGFGLVPPTPSWGELLAQSEKHITTAWWLAVYPSLALFCSLLALTFIGNGVREAFDPKAV